MSDNIDTSAIIERPVYTKDEEYVGVVEDIDKEQQGIGNLIIRGNLDLRKYSSLANLLLASTMKSCYWI
jgi:sporulation protein YlmC with PRC-barrel domain